MVWWWYPLEWSLLFFTPDVSACLQQPGGNKAGGVPFRLSHTLFET